MRRYTLVFHRYYGYGGYSVEFMRVLSKEKDLKLYAKDDLHFIVNGWPKVVYPNGTLVEMIKPI